MTVTLYRRDFRTNPDDQSSFFDDVLDTLKIPKDDQWEIEEVELVVESFGVSEC